MNSICEIPNERWHSSGAISDISDCSDAVEPWKIDCFRHRVKKSFEVWCQFHHQWHQWSQFHWYYQNFSTNFSEWLIINEHWLCSFLTLSQFGCGGAVENLLIWCQKISRRFGVNFTNLTIYQWNCNWDLPVNVSEFISQKNWYVFNEFWLCWKGKNKTLNTSHEN